MTPNLQTSIKLSLFYYMALSLLLSDAQKLTGTPSTSLQTTNLPKPTLPSRGTLAARLRGEMQRLSRQLPGVYTNVAQYRKQAGKSARRGDGPVLLRSSFRAVTLPFLPDAFCVLVHDYSGDSLFPFRQRLYSFSPDLAHGALRMKVWTFASRRAQKRVMQDERQVQRMRKKDLRSQDACDMLWRRLGDNAWMGVTGQRCLGYVKGEQIQIMVSITLRGQLLQLTEGWYRLSDGRTLVQTVPYSLLRTKEYPHQRKQHYQKQNQGRSPHRSATADVRHSNRKTGMSSKSRRHPPALPLPSENSSSMPPSLAASKKAKLWKDFVRWLAADSPHDPERGTGTPDGQNSSNQRRVETKSGTGTPDGHSSSNQRRVKTKTVVPTQGQHKGALIDTQLHRRYFKNATTKTASGKLQRDDLMVDPPHTRSLQDRPSNTTTPHRHVTAPYQGAGSFPGVPSFSNSLSTPRHRQRGERKEWVLEDYAAISQALQSGHVVFYSVELSACQLPVQLKASRLSFGDFVDSFHSSPPDPPKLKNGTISFWHTKFLQGDEGLEEITREVNLESDGRVRVRVLSRRVDSQETAWDQVAHCTLFDPRTGLGGVKLTSRPAEDSHEIKSFGRFRSALRRGRRQVRMIIDLAQCEGRGHGVTSVMGTTVRAYDFINKGRAIEVSQLSPDRQQGQQVLLTAHFLHNGEVILIRSPQHAQHAARPLAATLRPATYRCALASASSSSASTSTNHVSPRGVRLFYTT